jgi:hypothetical protein
MLEKAGNKKLYTVITYSFPDPSCRQTLASGSASSKVCFILKDEPENVLGAGRQAKGCQLLRPKGIGHLEFLTGTRKTRFKSDNIRRLPQSRNGVYGSSHMSSAAFIQLVAVLGNTFFQDFEVLFATTATESSRFSIALQAFLTTLSGRV